MLENLALNEYSYNCSFNLCVYTMFEYDYLGPCCSSLKIWTVSVLLDAQRNWPSGLKDNELILTYLQTARNKYISHTLKRVSSTEKKLRE